MEMSKKIKEYNEHTNGIKVREWSDIIQTEIDSLIIAHPIVEKFESFVNGFLEELLSQEDFLSIKKFRTENNDTLIRNIFESLIKEGKCTEDDYFQATMHPFIYRSLFNVLNQIKNENLFALTYISKFNNVESHTRKDGLALADYCIKTVQSKGVKFQYINIKVFLGDNREIKEIDITTDNNFNLKINNYGTE